jgi:hypothetical protein
MAPFYDFVVGYVDGALRPRPRAVPCAERPPVSELRPGAVRLAACPARASQGRFPSKRAGTAMPMTAQASLWGRRDLTPTSGLPASAMVHESVD